MRADRRLYLVAVLAGLAACGGPANVDLKVHDDSQEQAATVCAGSSTLKGIDVSSYQGTVNWASVKSAGIVWAYAKATEGTGYKDPTFSTNWSGMKNNGIYRGAYHFFHAEEDGKTQADYFLSAVGTLSAGDLPPMLDWEQTNPYNGGASCSTALANANAFISEIKTKTGKTPVIYTSPGIWSSDGCSANYSAEPLWEADYFTSDPAAGSGCYTSNTSTDCPNTPGYWTTWQMWQYGDCGSVSGISGHVDVDLFRGTLAQLQTFAGETSCGGKSNGYYCGGDGPTGSSTTLYSCSSNVATVEEECPGWCVVDSSGDFCARVHRPNLGKDLNKDGQADVCGRNSSGFTCWLSDGSGFPTSVSGPKLTDGGSLLSDANGFSGINEYTTTQFADFNGDGKADLCARASTGAICWPGTGSGFGSPTVQTVMTDTAGWNKPEYRQTIQLADINGDGKDDLCGRAYATFACWLYNSSSNSFKKEIDLGDMGDPEGWNQVQYYSTIVVADVTNDGKADVCGRGYAGFECFVATTYPDAGPGFNGASTAVSKFSDPNGGDAASVYSTITLGDVTGDGKLDVCGRTTAGYFCFAGNGNGTFSSTAITGPALSDTSGWGKPQYYSTIQLADIDGDGKADVCARAAAGIKCWLSTGSGFASTAISGPALSDTAGWSAGLYATTIQFADVDGDGRADVCARSSTGWECWLSTGNGFQSTPISTTLFSSSGWAAPKNLTTISLVGNAFGRYQPTTSSTTTSSSGTTTTSSSSSGTTTAGSSSSSSSSTGSSSGSSGSTGPSSSSSTTSSSSSSGGSSGSTTGASSSSGSTTSTTSSSSTGGSSSTTTSSSSTTAGSSTSGTSSTSSSTTSSTTSTTSSTSSGAGATTSTSGGSTGGAATSTGGTVGGGGGSTTSGKGAVKGGCASAPGGELLALAALLGLVRRRRR